ncbi:hypothetical protein AXG93_698s1260 [Marchantia polymorpha subsp. ruderalis]|uniref:Uncharacterized protein n=1 Tax=Marchantia polymorpha subsp. ruderalis TaxID=1480154 RepID=A0A176VFM7_MARPO|nr:hypothetical protein AXG93_698s1260 [Marchantia polymorpha subsp. ruderalis]
MPSSVRSRETQRQLRLGREPSVITLANRDDHPSIRPSIHPFMDPVSGRPFREGVCGISWFSSVNPEDFSLGDNRRVVKAGSAGCEFHYYSYVLIQDEDARRDRGAAREGGEAGRTTPLLLRRLAGLPTENRLYSLLLPGPDMEAMPYPATSLLQREGTPQSKSELLLAAAGPASGRPPPSCTARSSCTSSSTFVMLTRELPPVARPDQDSQEESGEAEGPLRAQLSLTAGIGWRTEHCPVLGKVNMAQIWSAVDVNLFAFSKNEGNIIMVSINGQCSGDVSKQFLLMNLIIAGSSRPQEQTTHEVEEVAPFSKSEP